ncbi:MAG: NfeD family protein [Oscillospiraceae bacterium]|jgi:membrane protein implicated in regulation of membrane protease activity|nr:NfeD family protein [Oscillospiraceae bacterium]
MPPEIVFWLAVLVLCLIVEANTVTLVSMWFALGALAALISVMPGGPFWLSLIVFAVTSAGSLLLLRPVCKQYLKKKDTRTNADRNIGETGLCTESIDNGAGQGAVRLLGKEWTARSVDGTVIAEGAQVRVESIAGVKLIVSPLPTPVRDEAATS